MIYKYDEKKSYEYENGFFLTSKPSRIGVIMAHYELYKMIMDLPGDLVECGVFKGASLMQWCAFRELLENENSRKIIGFDMFGEFPKTKNPGDDRFRKEWIEETGNEYMTEKELYDSLKFKNIGNVELIKGDILETIEPYFNKNPYSKIALLHIDTDIYEPAKKILETLYDRVVTGGVIIADDYGIAGETKAIDDFFGKDLKIKKFSFSHVRPSFLIKE